MIILRPTNLHWIDGTPDDPADICAHSGVDFRIDDHVFVQPSDGDWAVSAAALFLLRTLSKPHTKCSPVGQQLFPHCGQLVCPAEGDDALVFCCNTGMDFEIQHVENRFDLVANGRSFHVQSGEWRGAVAGFADAVHAFYTASSPKSPFDSDAAQAMRQFFAEWATRRAAIST